MKDRKDQPIGSNDLRKENVLNLLESRNLLSFLDAKDKLFYGSVNKEKRLQLSTKVHGPYWSPREFVLATTGVFRCAAGGKKQTDSKALDIKKFDPENCRCAWEVYHRAIVYPITKPYILHKLRDDNAVELLAQYGQVEDIFYNGRKYNPTVHTWTTNAFWVLSAIHTGKSFKLISPLTDDYVYSKSRFRVFSALALEVAALIRANYTVTDVDYNGHVYLSLSPEAALQAKSLTLRDITVNESEVKKAISIVNRR